MVLENRQTTSWEFYRYNPSLVAAIVFVVLFALATVIHTYRLLRTKTWYFIPLLLGGVFETIGYIGRILSSRQTPNWTLGPYLIQALFLLVAPALFAASIYMELGRIILVVDGESCSLIRRRWLTKIFVVGDVLSFLMQSGGGGIMAAGSSLAKTGQDIILGGLVIQVLFFGFFIVTALVFHGRIQRHPTRRSVALPWLKHQYTLYAASILILIRSLFRVIEYIEGNDGFLLRHEYFLYVFDAVLMWSVMILFLLAHPAEIARLLAEKPWEDAMVTGTDYEMMPKDGYGLERPAKTSA
ncbi:RTA1 like protein-domain-containing protein [Lipomyces chichibuensis]|uniref:RTA1 like protein-domain-containing protein n=1 Tax=Lipomyces chichibuensis TaxID=1546026 RepID=UPI003343F75F